MAIPSQLSGIYVRWGGTVFVDPLGYYIQIYIFLYFLLSVRMEDLNPFKPSNCTPRTPPRPSGSANLTDHIPDSPWQQSQKRSREGETPPEVRPKGKKPATDTPESILLSKSVYNNATNHINPVEGNTSCWNSGRSFADVVVNNNLQVAVECNPKRQFSGEDRLEFIDAVGEAIFALDVGEPCFESTTCRGQYLIVTAKDDFSFQWLVNIVSNLEIWDGFTLRAFPANEIPKIKKFLLWLPGKKKLSEEEVLVRLSKVNSHLNCHKWRIFSRKEEAHGNRFLVGIEETMISLLKELDFKPYWSTVRGQLTPVDELKRHRVSKAKKEARRKAVTSASQESKPGPSTSVKSTNNKSTENARLDNSVPVNYSHKATVPSGVVASPFKARNPQESNECGNSQEPLINGARDSQTQEITNVATPKAGRKGSKQSKVNSKITSYLHPKNNDQSTNTTFNLQATQPAPTQILQGEEDSLQHLSSCFKRNFNNAN